MRIAIATEQNKVAEHFGRCAQYTVCDIDGNSIINKKILNNPGHAPGAIPQFLKDNKVKIIITGGIGARAIDFFEQLNIGVIQGVDNPIEKVIEDYLSGILVSGNVACDPGAGKGHGIEKEECDHDESQEH